MAYCFPSFALVPFTKLLVLANRESSGLMRQISEPAVKLISDDMEKVGMVMEKFGKPTINISCETNDHNYRRFFTPLQTDSIRLFNMDSRIMNLEGFPVLQVAPHLLSSLQFTDGRHRVKASDRAFGSSIYDVYVLCCITTLQDSRKMIIDSYKKSEERPVVYASVQDLMQCLSPSFGIASSLDSLQKEILELGISKTYHIDIICKLQVHLFLSSKKLMDLHRDSELFTPESIFKAASKSFIQFIQETGRLQLSCYRYVLQGALSDLIVKETLQNTCILFFVHLSRIVANKKDRNKALALLTSHVMEILRDRSEKCLKLEKNDVPIILVHALRGLANESNLVSDGSFYIRMLRELWGETHSAIQVFLKSDTDHCPEIREHDAMQASFDNEPVKNDSSAAKNSVVPLSRRSQLSDSPVDLVSDDIISRRQDVLQPQHKRAEDVVDALNQDSQHRSSEVSNQESGTAHRKDSVNESETVSDVNARIADDKSVTSKGSLPKNGARTGSHSTAKRKSSSSSKLRISEPRRSKRLKYQLKSSERASSGDHFEAVGSERHEKLPLLRERETAIRGKVRKKRIANNVVPSNTKPGSIKANCGYDSLLRAEQLLSRVTFLRLESYSGEESNKTYKFSRLERLKDQGDDAVLFVDDTFLETGAAQECVKSITAVTPNVLCIVSISSLEDQSSILPNMQLISKGVVEHMLNQVTHRKRFVHVYGRNSSDWRGPVQFLETYHDVPEKVVLETLCESLMCRLEQYNKTSASIYDLMLSHSCGVLRILLELGLRSQYFKCLTEDQEHFELTTTYLSVMRNHVLKKCYCGGHSLLDANNESSINEYKGPLHDGVSSENPPFELTIGKRDSCPFGEVFPHTSLLLRKDRAMRVPDFAEDDRRLCSREPIGNDNGVELHRGAFISADFARKLQKETTLVDILYPKSFLVDSVSKMRFYETSLSPFEMRDLYVSGITHRKLWLYFSNRSVASLFNEKHEGGEVHFIPRYLDQDYLCLLYRGGFAAVRELNMGLLCCSLNPSLLERIPDNLICKNCGAVELLTHYGREYVHD